MRQEVAKGLPLVRSELAARGYRGNTLSEMAKSGRLYRVARGVYAPVEGGASGLFDYELAAKAVPDGVFTLASALRLHDLTDENPHRMTMAIPSDAHAPKVALPLVFVYMKRELLAGDVILMNTERVPIKVFSLERTLVECFKARNKIGVSTAVAALREAADMKRIDYAVLGREMARCRMMRVMAPYVEGLA